MKNDLLTLDASKETEKIVNFLKNTLEKQHIKKVVIGLSEGIDSTTAAYLLSKAIGSEHIIALHMPYFENDLTHYHEIVSNLKIPHSNQHIISIKNSVDSLATLLHIPEGDIRKGNVMARIRMITLFDFAKKEHALVCGTENKSEHLLGYFTRFGDAASDIEPLVHLYKTQVRSLATYLNVPTAIIAKAPTAGLWPGQTDEKEMGFSYEQADQVLYYYFEKHLSIDEIKAKGFENAEVIIQHAKNVEFKHQVPYTLPE